MNMMKAAFRMGLALSILFVILSLPVYSLIIFGEEYSLTVVLPLIIIILMFLMFIGMIVKDFITGRRRRLRKAREKLKSDVGAETRIVSKAIAEDEERSKIQKPLWYRNLLKRLSLKSSSDLARLKVIERYETYLEDIDAIEHELPYVDSHKIFENLIKTIRKFFSEHLNIRYEFTYEELEKEIGKKDKDIMFLSENLSKLHYSPEGFSKEELAGLIKEFRNIVNKIANVKRDELKKLKYHVGAGEDAIKNHDRIQKIDELLQKGRELLDKDFARAVNIYQDVHTTYRNMNSTEKDIVRSRIITFYEEIHKRIG